MITSWDDLPLTLRIDHIAEIYAIHRDTVRDKCEAHDPSIPTPFAIKPRRWRKSDVKKHYETWSVSQQRIANAQMAKAKRKLQAVS